MASTAAILFSMLNFLENPFGYNTDKTPLKTSLMVSWVESWIWKEINSYIVIYDSI